MTANALLSAVLADPFDDGPRFVYADWLEENEEPERAEFIRLQIELFNYQGEREWLENMPLSSWTGDEKKRDLLESLEPLVKRHTELCKLYVLNCAKWSKEFALSVFGENWLQLSANIYWGWSRGFPDEIRCTMAQWVGQECRYCSGGYFHNDMHHSPDTCSRCKGTGGVKGIAKAVCEQWPVTNVVLVDRYASFERCWLNRDYFAMQKAALFEDLFELLPLDGTQTSDWGLSEAVRYRTRTEAIAALSHAALTYGRRLAGLPELENK